MQRTVIAAALLAVVCGCKEEAPPPPAVVVPPTIQDLIAISKMNEWDADDSIKKFVGADLEAEFSVGLHGGTKEQDFYRVGGSSLKTQSPKIYYSCEYPWAAGRDFQALKEGQLLKVKGKIKSIERTSATSIEVHLDKPKIL